MSLELHPTTDAQDRRVAAVLTSICFSLVLVLLLLNFFTYLDPPVGQEGVIVNLGTIDFGQGNDDPAAAGAPPASETAEDAASEPVEEPADEPAEVAEVQPRQPEPEVQPEPEPAEPAAPAAPSQELIAQQEAAAIAAQRREEQQRAQAEARRVELAALAETQRQKDLQAKAAAQAAAERERVAAEQAAAEARAEALRQQTAGLFNGQDAGEGTGRGDKNKLGDTGDPDGVPNTDRLSGISSGGAGSVGGGLEGRGVVRSPQLQDNSNRKGRVVVRVCVNAAGRVTSARYTQQGSNTNDAVLRQLAEQNAANYQFSPGKAEEQCGSITYDFVVK